MALLLTTTTPPEILTKTSWYVTKKLSTLKFKGQVGATIYSSHDNTNDKNYTHQKSTHKRSNQNVEKVVGKRITTNLSTNIQMSNQSPLIMLKKVVQYEQLIKY